ncbi:MAG: tol-pal system protein YbgF [Hydrogenophaga sp.]
MLSKRPSASAFLTALGLSAAALWPLQAHALFDDNEARKAIIDLRNKFEAHRQATEAALARLSRQADDGSATGQRSLLEMANQNERLRSEIARLQGQIEQVQRDLSDLQKQQANAQAAAAERRKLVEPMLIEMDGMSFSAAPDETREFDSALALLRRAEFGPAEAAFSGMLRRFPNTGYLPSVLYWLGNAQFASRAYAQSLVSHQRLVRVYPEHARTPEALLAVANSELELKDSKAAKATLTKLARDYPQSEAAAAARERLAQLR